MRSFFSAVSSFRNKKLKKLERKGVSLIVCRYQFENYLKFLFKARLWLFLFFCCFTLGSKTCELILQKSFRRRRSSREKSLIVHGLFKTGGVGVGTRFRAFLFSSEFAVMLRRPPDYSFNC